MSVTDLTGTTWVFNDSIDISNFGKTPQTILMPADASPNDDSSYYLDGYIDDEGKTMTALVAVENVRVNTKFILVYPILYGISSGSKLVITGGTDATNSALISWFEANATQQAVSTKVSVDLTTLPGWSALSDGSHNITIVAKADGYRDSEHSSAVVVTKATTPTEDELAGTWVFNDSLDISADIMWNVNYTTNSTEYTTLRISLQSSPMGQAPCMGTSGSSVQFYNMGAWQNPAYKTITITSKLSEVTNGDTLLAWLQANATKQ